MCSVNILIIILQIADAINNLSFARFRVKDAEFDRKLAALPWGDKIEVKEPDENAPLPTQQEVSAWAQKAFLLLCELYRIKVNDKDLDAIKQTEVYVTKLTELANTIPDFQKAHLDEIAQAAYIEACKKLEEREWYLTKTALTVCRGAVFFTQSDTPGIQSGNAADGKGPYILNSDPRINNTVTVSFGQGHSNK